MLAPDDYDALKIVYLTLGSVLTSSLAVAKDKTVVIGWINANQDPDVDQLARIRVACEVLIQVGEATGDDIARLWFLGENIDINDADVESPLNAIIGGHFDVVRISAARMANSSLF